MALFTVKPKAQDEPITYTNEVAAKIQQRRYQILVHSLLYYELDINIISDHKWSEWAAELVQLQSQYPELSKQVIFADAFESFDGSTGFDLPYRDEQIVNIAHRILRIALDKGDSGAKDAINLIVRVSTTSPEYKLFNDKHNKVDITTQHRKVVKKPNEVKRKRLF